MELITLLINEIRVEAHACYFMLLYLGCNCPLYFLGEENSTLQGLLF